MKRGPPTTSAQARVRPCRAGAIAATLGLLLGACAGSGEKVVEPESPLSLKTVHLTMVSGANGNRPVAVELVRVRDVELVKELLRLEAGNWFEEAGEAFRQAHPDAFYDAWEIVPGTEAGPFEVRRRGKLAGVLFCNTTPATPPLRFGRDGEVTINIADSGCMLVGGKPSKKKGPFSWLPFR